MVASQLATLGLLHILVESQLSLLNSKLLIRCAASTCGESLKKKSSGLVVVVVDNRRKEVMAVRNMQKHYDSDFGSMV